MVPGSSADGAFSRDALLIRSLLRFTDGRQWPLPSQVGPGLTGMGLTESGDQPAPILEEASELFQPVG